LAPPHVLKAPDAILLELYANALARYRRVRQQLGEGPLLVGSRVRGHQISPLVVELRRAEMTLAELGQQLGLAPGARYNLATNAAPGSDMVDEFIRTFGPYQVIHGDRAGSIPAGHLPRKAAGFTRRRADQDFSRNGSAEIRLAGPVFGRDENFLHPPLKPRRRRSRHLRRASRSAASA
jgi:hypothetical protein